MFLNLGKLHVTYLIAWPYKRRASSKRRSVDEWLMSEAIVIIKNTSIFILNEPSQRATSDWHPFWHILFLSTKHYFSWKADFSQYLEEKEKSQVDAVGAFLHFSLWRLCRKSVTQGKKTYVMLTSWEAKIDREKNQFTSLLVSSSELEVSLPVWIDFSGCLTYHDLI